MRVRSGKIRKPTPHIMISIRRVDMVHNVFVPSGRLGAKHKTYLRVGQQHTLHTIALSLSTSLSIYISCFVCVHAL